LEQVSQGTLSNWKAVGDYIFIAMQEVATELGGDELSERIALESISDDALPNPAALKTLEMLSPGSADRVITRAGEVQKQDHERELAELRKPSLRKYGRALLNGAASINLFGTPSSKDR